jgi:putative oxidoreductase
MKKLMNCMCSEKWQPFAPLFLRVVTGAIFVGHGMMKWNMMGIPGTSQMLMSLGFPMPEVFAVLLIAAEVIGGLFLILGAFTHWTAKILAFVSLVALVTVHLKNGFMGQGGYEFILLILAASVSVMITGPGKWSVDHKLKHKKA